MTPVRLGPLVILLALSSIQCSSTEPASRGGRAQDRKSDAQTSIEPRSEPGIGQAFLARMQGDWSVAKVFHGRDGNSTASAGECHQHLIHGGRFLQSDFVFRSDDVESTGTGEIGFDAQTGMFTSFWIDSRSTRISIRQSVAAFDGNQIELRGKNLEGAAPGRASRTITTLEDGDRRILHRQYSIADGQPDRLVMELTMTRRD